MFSKRFYDNALYYYGAARWRFPALLTRPLGYFFYITEKCDLDCSYCWQRDNEKKYAGQQDDRRKMMTLDEWLKVIELIPSPSFIGLSGGEATISPVFEPTLKALKRFSVTINTNAARLKDTHIELLSYQNVRNISISLDGFAEVHDKGRALPGLFNTIVGNIERINRKRGKHISLTIKTVLTDENLETLPAFREFCEKELKADILNISFMKLGDHLQYSFECMDDLQAIFGTKAATLYQYRDPSQVGRILMDLLHGNGSSTCEVTLSPQVRSLEGIIRLLAGNGKDVYQTCYFPLTAVVILPNGEVIPCLAYSVGNLRDYNYDIRALLKSGKYDGFCKSIVGLGDRVPPHCNGCCFLKVKE